MVWSFDRTSTDNDDSFSSNIDLVNYINEYFWPRIQSCIVRLSYTLRSSIFEHKRVERQWTLDVSF